MLLAIPLFNLLAKPSMYRSAILQNKTFMLVGSSNKPFERLHNLLPECTILIYRTLSFYFFFSSEKSKDVITSMQPDVFTANQSELLTLRNN